MINLAIVGMERMVFPPYNRDQISQILEERLKSIKVFKEDAIELCARKVSSLSGDIRVALAICSFNNIQIFVIKFKFL